jgi:hypothetical protein
MMPFGSKKLPSRLISGVLARSIVPSTAVLRFPRAKIQAVGLASHQWPTFYFGNDDASRFAACHQAGEMAEIQKRP